MVAESKPLGGGEAKRLPVLAIKVSTGGVLKHGGVKGIEYYLKEEWRKGWDDWLEQAKEGFPSVLEHAVFTFYIEGCSRVCSHQLVRHRLVSFTQESQRYTEERIRKAFRECFGSEPKEFWRAVRSVALLFAGDVTDFEKNMLMKELDEMGVSVEKCSEKVASFVRKVFVVPPSLKDMEDRMVLSFVRALGDYAVCREKGGKMEDCRFLLPQAVRTSLLATANLREWLHVIEVRAHPKAQWEIRGIAECIKKLIEGEL